MTYDAAPDGKRIVFSVHGELFTAPTEEGGELRQLTDGAHPRPATFSTRPTASRSRSSPTRPAARKFTSSPPTVPARPKA